MVEWTTVRSAVVPSAPSNRTPTGVRGISAGQSAHTKWCDLVPWRYERIVNSGLADRPWPRGPAHGDGFGQGWAWSGSGTRRRN
jgi:hypothetical protein